MKLSVFSRRAAGFTMIELLVVIAIIVVLGATAFVVVSRAMGSSDLAKCREHVEQLGRLGLVYKDERFNYGRLPTSGMDDKEKTELLDESEGWWDQRPASATRADTHAGRRGSRSRAPCPT